MIFQSCLESVLNFQILKHWNVASTFLITNMDSACLVVLVIFSLVYLIIYIIYMAYQNVIMLSLVI